MQLQLLIKVWKPVSGMAVAVLHLMWDPSKCETLVHIVSSPPCKKKYVKTYTNPITHKKKRLLNYASLPSSIVA